MPLALIYHWFLCKRSRFLLSYNLIRCIPRPHAAPASPAIAAAMTSSGPCLAPGCCPCAVRSPASPATGPSRMFRRSCRHRLTEAQASGGHACTATGRGCSCTTSPVAPPPHRRCSLAQGFLQGRELLRMSSLQSERMLCRPRAVCAPAGYPAGCFAKTEASDAVCRCGSSFGCLQAHDREALLTSGGHLFSECQGTSGGRCIKSTHGYAAVERCRSI